MAGPSTPLPTTPPPGRGVLGAAAVLVLLAAGLGLSGAGGAAHRAGVDFERGVAWAEASGPDARAARREAVRQVIEVLGPVPVTADETVAGVLASDSAVKSAVEGAAHAAPLAVTAAPDDRVRGVVRLPLDGPVLLALLPPLRHAEARVPTACADYSGVVVDARGLPVEPALAPRLRAPGGRVVYGPGRVGRDAAAARGVVGWSHDLEAARRSPRVGAAPRIVRAVGTRGPDLILSGPDARALEASQGRPAALAEARVLVVADRARLRRGDPFPEQSP